MCDMPPDLIAYADQRAAHAVAFVDSAIEVLRPVLAVEPVHDALGIVRTAARLEPLTTRAHTDIDALTDVLAVALRRLAMEGTPRV